MAASFPPARRQRAAMSGEYAALSPVMEPAVLPQASPSSCYFHAECSCRSRHPSRFSSAFVHYYDEGGAANSLTRLGSPCRNRCLHSRLYLVRFTCDGIPCGQKGCACPRDLPSWDNQSGPVSSRRFVVHLQMCRVRP